MSFPVSWAKVATFVIHELQPLHGVSSIGTGTFFDIADEHWDCIASRATDGPLFTGDGVQHSSAVSYV